MSTIQGRTLHEADMADAATPPGVATLLADLIEMTLSCRTVPVLDGKQALDQALGLRPVAWVLDVDLPMLTGIQVARSCVRAWVKRPRCSWRSLGGQKQPLVRLVPSTMSFASRSTSKR